LETAQTWTYSTNSSLGVTSETPLGITPNIALGTTTYNYQFKIPGNLLKHSIAFPRACLHWKILQKGLTINGKDTRISCNPMTDYHRYMPVPLRELL
jgi:hypothetical protein